MNNEYTSLTQNQQLLWLGQELNPDSPMYNMAMTYEIKDVISFPHFKTAFKKLVEKSDALRSVFELKDEKPVQKYLSKIEFEVEFKNFSNEDFPIQAYKIWENKRVKHQFDIKKCLFDCVLIKLSDGHFIWYINQHHLITDGWSTSIIFSEMSKLYTKVLQEDSSDFEELLPSYKNFVAFEQKIKNSEKGKEIAKHWQEKLKKLPSTPALYHKKNLHLNTGSERSNLKLGKERSEKIRALANKKGIRGWSLDLTLYNIFLTTLFAYIYRVTGQENVLIGSPTHNRTSKSFKNTIGFFVEIFPLQTKITETETFMSLLKKVQIESNSFLKNVQAGASSSDLNRNFNVFFNYINAINTDFKGSSVTTNWVHSGHTDPRHHIRLHVHDFDNTGEIQLYFDLNTHVFNQKERASVQQHFLNLLDAFIADSNQNLDTVSIISKKEISKINLWNDTSVAYDKKETLLTKFESQAKKTPNNIALKFQNETLTYQELDQKSNQVAHFLINKNIKKGDIVIVSLERSLEMMIYIYGILKAGAVYLPVDVFIPAERLLFIIKDAESKILLYNHHHINNVIKSEITTYHSSLLNKEISSLSTSSNAVITNSEDLAYIIYTSGSTGEPKGVKCHHRGICNRLNWMNSDHPLTSADVLLQKTPITFDVSLWELFWPLQKGASLVIEKPEAHKNPEQLVDTIQNEKVTIIHFVPSMLAIFMQTENVASCTSLNKIICSGEALSAKTVSKTHTLLEVDIYNLYGPTEASVDVTSWLCEKNTNSNTIPIGKPVTNTKLYIVDAFMNLAPIGIPGELYISGTQVAKGYLNRENLTKERFVKDIFSDDYQQKMYRTGDLVKYRQDGAIEFLGRTDNQIKLRGQRIELGEIEKILEKHIAITKAVVKVDKQDNLVAFYTGTLVNSSEIIAHLETNLPIYMVPSFFVYQEKFDLLSSGKIDRKKLQIAHFTQENQTKKAKTKPNTEIEEVIYNVWKDVLEIEEIGIYENFIRIGGNSLSAISITSRLKEILELEVSINDVFNYPNIQLYAEYIEEMITKLLNEN